jgi:predicted TIM-barrel fold metal-dependent hydrolase
MEDAADWYDSTTVVSEQQRQKIGRTNAIKLFKLDLDQ